jgi:hypothetical protein
MLQKKQPTYQDLTKLMFTNGNPKTDKNLKIESLKKYWIKRLNLAPASISGFNTCASASKGCREACLHEAGNPVFMPQKTLGSSSILLILLFLCCVCCFTFLWTCHHQTSLVRHRHVCTWFFQN